MSTEHEKGINRTRKELRLTSFTDDDAICFGRPPRVRWAVRLGVNGRLNCSMLLYICVKKRVASGRLPKQTRRFSIQAYHHFFVSADLLFTHEIEIGLAKRRRPHCQSFLLLETEDTSQAKTRTCIHIHIL